MRSFHQKYGIWCLLLAVLTLPAVAWGVHGSMQLTTQEVDQWVPKSLPEVQTYDWFFRHFGTDEVAVVSWPGCTLADRRLDLFAEAVRRIEVARGGAAPTPLFERVLTGREMLAELTAPPLRLSRREALHRLDSLLVGPDRETTCAVLVVSQAGAEDRHAAVDAIYATAESACGIPGRELRLGGPTVDSVAVDRVSEESLHRWTAVSALLVALAAWWCLRSVPLTLMVLATSQFCVAVSAALVYYLGSQLHTVLVVMPTLVSVLSISGAIHLANYFRDTVRQRGPAGAAHEALRLGWQPCLLAAITTAIGLGSLCVSQVKPVWEFGVYSALGILVSVLILFLVLPTLMDLWANRAGSPGRWAQPQQESRVWARASRLVARYHAGISLSALVVLCGMALGLGRMQTSVKVQDLFAAESDILQDYRWLEERLGPLVPIEIVIHFEEASSLSFARRMMLVGRVETALRDIDQLEGVLSARTLAPRLPSRVPKAVRPYVRFRLLERKLPELRPYLVEAGYVGNDAGEDLWRITGRVRALNDVDYGYFLHQVRDRIEPLLEAERSAGNTGVRATYTGSIPLIYRSQRMLLEDLSKSFLTAFALIAVAMILLLRSVPAGMVAMLPNLLPALLMFGGMAWLQIKVDIGSLMTASVALGIAVDDTLHFLSWFRRGLEQGGTRRDAVELAYARCAAAMIQTSLICGCGMLVFALSEFVPTARFAWLTTASLAAALLGDLVLLPALLIGPLGRFFELRVSHRQLATA